MDLWSGRIVFKLDDECKRADVFFSLQPVNDKPVTSNNNKVTVKKIFIMKSLFYKLRTNFTFQNSRDPDISRFRLRLNLCFATAETAEKTKKFNHINEHGFFYGITKLMSN